MMSAEVRLCGAGCLQRRRVRLLTLSFFSLDDMAHPEIGAHTDTQPRIAVTQSINHTGEVNRARYMPQNPDLIATKTVMGEVYIFDRTKHSLKPSNDVCRPDITLRGHTKEGSVLDVAKSSLVRAA